MQTITLLQLAYILIPALAVVAAMFFYSLKAGKALYAMARMLGQLLLVGYFLTFIFNADSPLIVLVVLTVMMVASSWIALNSSNRARKQLFQYSLVSIALSGGVVLGIVILAVVQPDPWYAPRVLIPLAGMIFANAMTSVSLTAERLEAELDRGVPWPEASTTALQTGFIPLINSLLAVGLVSLPGMMTGQILAGVSPLVAARYQIMVMCMIFASGGVSIMLYVTFSKRVYLSTSPVTNTQDDRNAD